MSEPLYIMQNSFTGGEFSPVMDARQDLQKYATGVKTMKNFYVLPHGAAVNRPGTHYIAATKDHSKRSRLIPFQYSEEQAYTIEFGHQYCRFYRNGGQVVSGGAPYEIVTPYSSADLALLKFTQSADVMYLVHPKYKPKVLSRLADTNWMIADFTYKEGPFAPVNLTNTTITPSAVTGNITLTASAGLFDSLQVGSLWKLEHDVEAQTIAETIGNQTGTDANNNPIYNLQTSSVKGMGQWNLTTHGTWTGKIYLEKSEDGGTTWTKLRTYSGKDDYNVIASGNEDEQLVLVRVKAFEWTSGTVNVDLQFVPFTVAGIVRITAVADSTHASATVIKELGGTAATDTWYEGAWSEYRGWPAANVFYQNRLVFGNTAREPQTVWTSKTGDYTNFGVSSPVVDDDAISTPLVSEKVNAIRSLKAMSEILGLTAGGHWKIGPGSDSSAFTPTSAAAVQQGYYGASDLDPLIIGNRILYTQEKGSIVRDIGYDFQSDSYMGSDLTLLAEHLFRGRKIVEWAYQQEPNGIVWCVCDDGALLGFTYLREQEVWGWHRHETDGSFESVCTIPGETRDEVWCIVSRTVNGQTRRYVEQMAARMETTDPADQYFVDCGLSYDGSPATMFSGLDHLEGKTVAILADGNVHPRQTVTDGSITLGNAARKVHIGLGYTCDLQTLNIDFPTKTGTIQTRYKRITKSTLRVENTRGALIGPSFDKLFELKMRSSEVWGAPIALFTGDKDMQFNTGSDREGHVCIRMADPLPITILAIVAEVTVDD